jgi:TonB family protein
MGGKMLRRSSLAIAATCWLFQAANASGNPLDPAGKWVVDYRDDQCLASREFGSPRSPVSLGIRPAINGETYLLIVARKHSGPQPSQELQGAVDFGNGRIKSWLLEYESKPSGTDLYQFRISAGEMNQAKTASHLKLSPPNAPDIDLKLEVMSELLKTLQDCTANLKLYWNSDGEKDGRIAKSAKGDLRKLFSSDDYPEEAFVRSQGGRSQLILLIDEAGKVGGCDVLSPSGIPALDIMGCQVIRSRARFTPALDTNGKPVRSIVVTPPIVWSM